MFDVWVAIVFGAAGYLMKRVKWPMGPLILGFLLGPMLEISLHQSLNMGGPTILLRRPIAAGLIVSAIVVLCISVRYLSRVPDEVVESDTGK